MCHDITPLQEYLKTRKNIGVLKCTVRNVRKFMKC